MSVISVPYLERIRSLPPGLLYPHQADGVAFLVSKGRALIGGDAKTTTGEVIRREVTVFSTVEHGPGHVTTGWRYRDGTGSVPLGQNCYYSAPNNDSSSTRIEIAVDGARLPTISASLVPELEGALAKCQWWKR